MKAGLIVAAALAAANFSTPSQAAPNAAGAKEGPTKSMAFSFQNVEVREAVSRSRRPLGGSS